jgi:beta-carotene 3-hydroxylase
MIIVSILIAIAVAVGMEFVAWAEHKFIMHGFLWILHEDHHKPIRKGFQLNDLFVILFALPSFLLIFLGLLFDVWPLPAIGIGMAIYGVGYVLFHDIMFHKHLKWLKIKPKGAYFEGIITAHRLHHRQNGKEDGMSFGFLFAPRAYAEQSRGPPVNTRH